MSTFADTKDHQLALGGDMAWKKALFLGGAVLLLAACSSATAPDPQVRDGDPAAAAKTTSGSKPVIQSSVEDLICSGYYVRTGREDECLVDELPIMP
jgi:hypothetical protein